MNRAPVEGRSRWRFAAPAIVAVVALALWQAWTVAWDVNICPICSK